MGYQEYDVRVPAIAGEQAIRQRIEKVSRLKNFSYEILKKSLDARKKSDIVWQLRVGVVSDTLKGGKKPELPTLHPQRKKRDDQVIVVGSGPAGMFAADFLVRSGFKVTILERGSQIETRKAAIEAFEKGGAFPTTNNYSFGEGGAGTFSDGKLSSRTKNINAERNYIFQAYLQAGAPDEIMYMTHPHLGSDQLFNMTLAMRTTLENLGCSFRFDTQVLDILTKDGIVYAVKTNSGDLSCDQVIFACGHSAFETFRMLISRGVPFVPKNFAVGFRAEHHQETINLAQWGLRDIPGVKAAEYRLTSQTTSGVGVYSFCMCPGGVVVPAAAYADTNIVNGMSNFARDSEYANAAVVAGVDLGSLLGHPVTALESLLWLEELERSFFRLGSSYRAPAMRISDFLSGATGAILPESSYVLGLEPVDLKALLPAGLIGPLREGLAEFCRKLKGYEEGILLGLESKTSAPLQVERHPEKLYSQFLNLYVAGEGSGWSGGIVSSAADGLRVAQAIAG